MQNINVRKSDILTNCSPFIGDRLLFELCSDWSKMIDFVVVWAIRQVTDTALEKK